MQEGRKEERNAGRTSVTSVSLWVEHPVADRVGFSDNENMTATRSPPAAKRSCRKAVKTKQTNKSFF